MSGVGDPPRVYRGSRKHVLDWVESPGFVEQLREMLRPIDVAIADHPIKMPVGWYSPTEARLEQPDTPFAVLDPIRRRLATWWLVYEKGARTPTWDLVVSAEIEGKAGLILVEAKAHAAELKRDGKDVPDDPDSPSGRNHQHISDAIGQARAGLKNAGIQTEICVETNYQLANRIAFTWKLSTLGVPVVLIYLGFTGDTGISDVGLPFPNDSDWFDTFCAYSAPVTSVAIWNRRIQLSEAAMWMLIRSKPVIEISSRRVAA